MYNIKYIEKFLILTSTTTGCILIFGFASLICIPREFMTSAIGLKICAITSGTERYKSIIKIKRHDKRVLLAKSKLNSIEVLISKALINSVTGNDEFSLTNNMHKKYNEMKKEIKKI